MNSNHITIAEEIELAFTECREKISEAREEMKVASRNQDLRALLNVSGDFLNYIETNLNKIHNLQNKLLDLATEVGEKNTQLYMAMKHQLSKEENCS